MTRTDLPAIVLASSSPRRSDLLAEAGIAFRISVPDVEEESAGFSPADLCLHNARIKAAAVSAHAPHEIVVAADTVVSLDDRILGKPASMTEATEMIHFLSGRTHEVLTGVCIRRQQDEWEHTFVESTRVTFHSLSPVEIKAYLESINPLDKAGAYAAQEDNGRIIASIDGLFSNVVGLPVEPLLDALRDFPRPA